MMTEPLVSILCTVYNKEPWLAQTIESFLAQERDFPIEILLIDDASTDGSKAIIATYQEKYPDLIRTFYNQENQGIAKTWVSICQEARGHYIARCDGDDFWLDKQKLKKQLSLLADNPQAKWSNTDFDVYNEYGELVSQAGFENGFIPLADTFEKMLATRGFTMASTWLVERELMLEVNAELDLTTSDDTFNLQMDLFQRTELAYLPEATVAYVINQGSDSRPKDFNSIVRRFNTLLRTQNQYLDKYPNSDYREMLRILLDRNNRYELELTKREGSLSQVGIENVTIYLNRGGKGFNQEDILQFPLAQSDAIDFQLPDDCSMIRVDLSEIPNFFKEVHLISKLGQTDILPDFTNAIVLGDAYIFPNRDPQMLFTIPVDLFGRDLQLKYEIYEVDDIHSDDYIGKILAQNFLDAKAKIRQLQRDQLKFEAALRTVETQQKDIEELTRLYNSVICSRRWTIPTKIINFFRRKK
ncbi:glycosyltransferase [Streptococcus minor]|uniref:Glycosyltransferase n=1 Tax=Streptococcus minor TaxID=229549 RepID=A0A3P1V8I6_9STRE|nr:glycosyltransferase [Streptococcus minor]RRD30451.1 glycosyltransferase [Streptococcus minor]